MENAADALKIVLGIFVFIIGLTMLFSMASQARETASILISRIDNVRYYDYYEDADEQTIDKNGNRIVTIQDIIPTLYRYSQENYGVTIVNNSGAIIARFDLDTENACNNWPTANSYSKYKFISEINKIFDEVNNLANKVGKTGVTEIPLNVSPPKPTEKDNIIINSEGMTSLFKKWYGQATFSGTVRREYYCLWIGSPGWIAQRIDSDVSRNKCNV